VIEASADMVVAIAWYQPDEWDQLRQLCPDLDDTYEEWLAAAQKAVEDLGDRLQGRIVKVVLTVDELRRWKRATGREVTSKVRGQLAVKLSKRQFES
jgi:hypothetical protein